MTLLAIDPGRGVKPTIGYCLFNMKTGEEIERGELDWQGLVNAMFASREGLYFYVSTTKSYIVNTIVIEDFVNDPRVHRGGQRNGTSEVIGAVEFTAAQCYVPFYRQDRSMLNAAKLHAQYTDTHKHLPHKDAAYLHGYHWLVGQGIVNAVGIDGTM